MEICCCVVLSELSKKHPRGTGQLQQLHASCDQQSEDECIIQMYRICRSLRMQFFSPFFLGTELIYFNVVYAQAWLWIEQA